jgi:penicillin-insensitive murein endopeptidase
MRTIRWLLAGIGLAALAAPAFAQQKIDFFLNWVPGGDHAPYFYAKKMGWYAAEGIDLNIEPGKGSALAVQKVDIAYFYRNDARWYRRGNARNLDLPRNWAFVRALVSETDVELILIDHSIQALLREHALSIGEDPVWVDSIFRGGSGLRPLIRHARGHATHVHVRFFNPLAQETARRAYAALVDRGVVPPVRNFIQHRARRGDTLGKLSKKYGVSVVAIKQANRLKKSLIREKRTYLIPVAKPRPLPPSRRLSFPPRRIPPERVPPERVSKRPLDHG